MRTLYISFLAFAVSVTAEEANAPKRKRGIYGGISYEAAPLPFNGLINLDYSGIPLPSIPITSYAYNHLGNAPLLSYPISPPPPKPNGYSTSYGLGAYAGEDFIQQQLTSGVSARLPQTFPVQDIRHLTAIGPQAISSHPLSPYSFRNTEYSPPPPIPGRAPAFQPVQSVSSNSGPSFLQPARPVNQPGIAFGSGSLGITRLSNGNYALGSGSIGYAGSLAAAAATPTSQAVAPAPAPAQLSYNGQGSFRGY